MIAPFVLTLYPAWSLRIQSTPEDCWNDYVEQHYEGGIIPNCQPRERRYSASNCFVLAKHKIALYEYRERVMKRRYIHDALPPANHIWMHRNKNEAQKQSRYFRAEQREQRRMIMEYENMSDEEESSVVEILHDEDEWWKALSEEDGRTTRSKKKEIQEKAKTAEQTKWESFVMSQQKSCQPAGDIDISDEEIEWWKKIPENVDKIAMPKVTRIQQQTQAKRKFEWESLVNCTPVAKTKLDFLSGEYEEDKKPAAKIKNSVDCVDQLEEETEHVAALGTGNSSTTKQSGNSTSSASETYSGGVTTATQKVPTVEEMTAMCKMWLQYNTTPQSRSACHHCHLQREESSFSRTEQNPWDGKSPDKGGKLTDKKRPVERKPDKYKQQKKRSWTKFPMTRQWWDAGVLPLDESSEEE